MAHGHGGSAASVLPIVPSEVTRTGAEPREAAIAKFRELADRLERGELHGARCEWRHGLDVITTVEVDAKQVRYNKIKAGSERRTRLDAKELPFIASRAALLAEIDAMVGLIESRDAELEKLRAKLAERE
jgi:hypothetical protein